MSPSKTSKKINQEPIKVEKKNSKSNDKRISRTQRAGIIFPVTRVERLLREGRFGFKKLDRNAPVYLASVLEYLVLEVLEVSLQFCKQNKKHRIIPTHINWGVETDVELSALFKNVQIAGAGIVPMIVEYPKSRSKKKESPSSLTNAPLQSRKKQKQ